MTHYRQFFDNKHLGAWDLEGEDRNVRIVKVERIKVGGQQGRAESSKILLHFAKTSKTMVCNVTNATTIAGIYGNVVAKWEGKRITLYPTLTSVGGRSVDCIRVRPTAPSSKAPEQSIADREPDAEMRTKQDEAFGRVDPETGKVPAEDEPGGARDGEP